MKTPRRTLAAGITALLLAAPAAGLASSASAAAPAAASARAAGSPIAAVKTFAKSLEKADGKATCKVMTKGYQRKIIKAAVSAGAPADSTCTQVMGQLGEQVKANGGIPAFTLKIEKRTAKTAVVRLTYKQQDLSGTYTTKLVGGSWLIGGSTVSTS
ncbi:hypothetical protein [Nocardioides flavescens]|uniref:DUF4878 domain-containing protein n=1 Tax=Nocardioides flavescens TaxID=2691959 RepID=A0A6L7F2V6_9ACTN|nr:hypothetical protein [Nocardioides flavescens]MXG90144.1 hypothetical protein [Nocardioides flavescens]